MSFPKVRVKKPQTCEITCKFYGGEKESRNTSGRIFSSTILNTRSICQSVTETVKCCLKRHGRESRYSFWRQSSRYFSRPGTELRITVKVLYREKSQKATLSLSRGPPPSYIIYLRICLLHAMSGWDLAVGRDRARNLA